MGRLWHLSRAVACAGLSDPKAAIADELGVPIPDDFSIDVHEESPAHAHLVLPPDSRLSPALRWILSLEHAHGGNRFPSDVFQAVYAGFRSSGRLGLSPPDPGSRAAAPPFSAP